MYVSAEVCGRFMPAVVKCECSDGVEKLYVLCSLLAVSILIVSAEGRCVCIGPK